jgi:hypothetical protein
MFCSTHCTNQRTRASARMAVGSASASIASTAASRCLETSRLQMKGSHRSARRHTSAIKRTEPLPQQESEAVLAPAQPETAPQPPVREENPAPATTAPQPACSRTAVPTWKRQIVAILERNKRYPP